MKKECFYAKKSIQLIVRWYRVEINPDNKQYFCGRGFPSGLTVPGGGVDIPHSGREQVQISAIGIATRKSPVVFRAMAEPEKPILVSAGMMLAVADKVKVVPVLGKVINIFLKTKTHLQRCNLDPPARRQSKLSENTLVPIKHELEVL